MLVDISVPRNIDDKGANEVFFILFFSFFPFSPFPCMAHLLFLPLTEECVPLL